MTNEVTAPIDLPYEAPSLVYAEVSSLIYCPTCDWVMARSDMPGKRRLVECWNSQCAQHGKKFSVEIQRIALTALPQQEGGIK